MLGGNLAISMALDIQSLFPNWPPQHYNLVGFIVFAIFMGWIIHDKQKKINELEASYEYALFFEGLLGAPRANDLQIGLVFKNTIEKPIEYKMDVSKLYIEIDDNRPVNPQYVLSGSVISKGATAQFRYPSLKKPENFPCKGTLRYELVYGRPGKMMFRQRKEMELDVQSISGKIYISPAFTLQEDNPIGK